MIYVKSASLSPYYSAVLSINVLLMQVCMCALCLRCTDCYLPYLCGPHLLSAQYFGLSNNFKIALQTLYPTTVSKCHKKDVHVYTVLNCMYVSMMFQSTS